MSVHELLSADSLAGVSERGHEHEGRHGALLVRVPYVVAVGLLAVNDGALKAWSPSWVTGKLSDFAGLFFAPVLLLMLVELLPWMREHRTLQARRVVCYGLIGAVFSFAQVLSLIHI